MTSKFALVIANTEYQDESFARLSAPGKDAEEFAQVLRELATFDDVQVLLNEGEGKTRRSIARFFAERKRDDLLLLYFSGHGVRNDVGHLYLAAHDTEKNILEASGIPAEFVTQAMNNSRSQRQLLILDCCNSGAFAHGTKSVEVVGKSMGIATAFEGSGFGRVVLTATDATQYAWEGDKVIGDTQKSLFTHFLIEGLKGEADRDGDGRIHVDELYDYAYEQVVRRTPKQTPGKWSYKQQGDIVLRENLQPREAKPVSFEIPKNDRDIDRPVAQPIVKKRSIPKLNRRLVGGVVGGVFVFSLCVWGGASLLNNLSLNIQPTSDSNSTSPEAALTGQALPNQPTQTIAPSAPTDLPVNALDIGSTMTGEDGMTLLYVPAGEFTMGSEEGGDNEKPVHDVYLDAYWIDQTEVTTSMYAQCVQERFCNPPSSNASFTRASYFDDSEFRDYPVIYVSWEDAQSYCSWADRRLPTEAEWEKAARGSNALYYPWGDSAPDSTLLNYYDGDVGDTSKVGSYPKGMSPFGALDMAGNVAEWVADRYRDFYYADSPQANPLGPESGEARVVRGGAWEDATLACGNFYSTGYVCVNSPSIENYAAWKRDYDGPGVTKHYYGFRCAVSAIEQTEPNTTQPNVTEILTTPSLDIGSTLTGKDGMTLLYVPAGEFTMGSDSGFPDESPIHTVYLDPFWIDQTEVTNKMYSLCAETTDVCARPTNTSYYGNPEYDNHPVVYVDWGMARSYCEWVGRRLPTEAEWEKAARGTDQRIYPWGDTIDQTFANYDRFVGDTTKVGSYEKGMSFYGAFDMAGNVWEWVNDRYSQTYYSSFDPGSVLSNPLGPDLGAERVLRGGSWQVNNLSVRSANRTQSAIDHIDGYAGFRCAMSATP